MTDWVCELHNDDPDDPAPAELVRSLADPRIHFVQHPHNLGPIKTFNLFYRPVDEPFSSLLEDDNTWGSDFLETMLAALDAHPKATLAWCNQRVIRENRDGQLHETATLVNPAATDARKTELHPWGNLRQVMGALHANGAMLLRSQPDTTYVTPQIPFGCVEAFRERLLPHPLVYVPQALATFTTTVQTARNHDGENWGAALTLLAASYLKHAQLDDATLDRLCSHFRNQHPAMTNELIAAAFNCTEVRPLLRHVTTRDWLRYARTFVRHPLASLHALRAKTRHSDWWDLLDQRTAQRFVEARAIAKP